jgi:PKD repeat protein
MIRGQKNTLPILLLIALFGWACTEDDKDASGPLPVARFAASATEISAGDTVYFTDQSENDPYLWTWLFQGGEPSYSNQPNPVVVFPGSGNYKVELTVRNDYGADHVAKDNYMVVTAPPVIDIDIPAQIRLEFEGNLNSTGEIELVAETAGAADYTIRPGGGEAFAFNGSNALTLPGYNGINGAGPRSVAMWVNSTSTARGVLTNWGAAGTFSRATFAIQPAGFIRFEYQGGGQNASTVITDGQWHHVAYTYDGSTIILYVNGEPEFTVTGVTLRTGEAGETEVTVGSQYGAAQYIGGMDDFRIFDVALSPEDVKILSEMN